ncbi:hypothetical protein GCM10011297_03450 [Bacterioplanes sanyensis]|uniref:hypothetical protein n=1 Tax=Bacterioplanes sanyensis TaxID=1249553 RepID=UPI00167A3D39|nr:hypothetical protein [Bacterioplanes sanyensis]GGY33756.1 hypothetical protein GCM10011297_03450 [Bacterioplanes sanyensis]
MTALSWLAYVLLLVLGSVLSYLTHPNQSWRQQPLTPLWGIAGVGLQLTATGWGIAEMGGLTGSFTALVVLMLAYSAWPWLSVMLAARGRL